MFIEISIFNGNSGILDNRINIRNRSTNRRSQGLNELSFANITFTPLMLSIELNEAIDNKFILRKINIICSFLEYHKIIEGTM